jgi:hypothetical protein
LPQRCQHNFSFARKALCFSLSPGQLQNALRDQTLRELVNRPFQFQKRSQPFIGTHNETLSVVAMHNELNQFGLSKRPTIRHNSRHDSAFIGLLPSKRAD